MDDTILSMTKVWKGPLAMDSDLPLEIAWSFATIYYNNLGCLWASCGAISLSEEWWDAILCYKDNFIYYREVRSSTLPSQRYPDRFFAIFLSMLVHVCLSHDTGGDIWLCVGATLCDFSHDPKTVSSPCSLVRLRCSTVSSFQAKKSYQSWSGHAGHLWGIVDMLASLGGALRVKVKVWGFKEMPDSRAVDMRLRSVAVRSVSVVESPPWTYFRQIRGDIPGRPFRKIFERNSA